MRSLVLRALIELKRYGRLLATNDFEGLHSRVRLEPVALTKASQEEIERICDAVAYACIWYFHEVKCLQRSAAAVTLLRQHGVPATMVIGATRLPLWGHAWAEVDGRVVNDKPEVQTTYMTLERC